MKLTKQIFLITGADALVRQTLEEIKGFKAVTVINGKISDDIIKEVFANNKSIVCRGFEENNFILQFAPITIFASEGIITTSTNVIDVRYNIVRQFMEIANKYSIDIGDHKSNTTLDGPSKSDCIFCKLLSGHPVHHQPSLYETQNFLVVPGSGSFIHGYLMILPKDHIMSCAELTLEQLNELYDVISDIKFILKSIFHNEVLIWENGSGTGGKGKPKTSIVHAHIHACPCSDTLDILEATRLTGVPLNPIKKSDLSKYASNPYLLVINFNNNWYISSDPNLYIPRQYIRQLLAKELNIIGDVWDWRLYPFWNNVEKTAQIILEFLRDNFDNLSPRIQKATEKFIF